jgi:hypothetical protein
MSLTVERNPAVLWRRTLTGVLLFADGEDDMTRLSAPGDVVWQLIDERRPVEEIIEDLGIIYETEDLRPIRGDVTELLEALAKADMVRLRGS